MAIYIVVWFVIIFVLGPESTAGKGRVIGSGGSNTPGNITLQAVIYK